MSKRVIELIRVSTQAQAGDDRAGIPAQREINRRTAEIFDLKIVKTFEIVDVSGASVLASPEMQNLLRLIESPDIAGVVTKEFSRVIRPGKLTDLALLETFIETNTLLFLPDGPIDLASKTGRFIGTIRAAFAGLERREILDRMHDAKEAIRRAGRHAGGESSLPFGVGYSKAKGWYLKAEAELVKHAFTLFLSGITSYVEIARKLNIPRTSLRYILANPIYSGWRVYDRTLPVGELQPALTIRPSRMVGNSEATLKVTNQAVGPGKRPLYRRSEIEAVKKPNPQNGFENLPQLEAV